MNSSNPILVGCLEDTIWIRVEGKGSYENSGSVRELAAKMIEQGYRHFIVDLEDCPVMDSTFMGTLTGVALRLAAPGSDDREEPGAQGLEVINANTRCRQLMKGLGLNHIFEIDEEGTAHLEERELVSRQMQARREEAGTPVEAPKPPDKVASAEMILDAHEALTEVCEENIPRFRDVIEFLKKDLKELGRPINHPA